MTKKAALIEVTLLYLAVLVAIRLLVLIVSLGAPDFVMIGAPVLFLFGPVWLLRWKGEDPWKYPLDRPAFDDREPWVTALKYNAVIIGVIALPFFAGYHLWQTQGLVMLQDLLGMRFFAHAPSLQWIWPSQPVQLVLYHLLFVAFPEEVFYRGYMQSRLDEAFGTPYQIWGAPIGVGLLITCVLFAFGHTLVVFQWWHVFIIFPSLCFGWLRNRTGQVIAGTFFHAWCNVTVTFLDTLYGIVPP